MKSSTKSRVFADGSNSGIHVKESEDHRGIATKIALSDSDVGLLNAYIQKLGIVAEKEGEKVANLPAINGEGYAILSLVKRRAGNKYNYFLNVRVNPTRWLTGQNLYGSSNMVLDLLQVYTFICDKAKLVNLREKVNKLDINVYDMEIAAYTKKGFQSIFFGVVNALYLGTFNVENGKRLVWPANEMGVQCRTKPHLFDKHLRLLISAKDIDVDNFNESEKNIEFGLSIYRKYNELLEKGLLSEFDEAEIDAIKGRARIDLQICNAYFKKNGIKTLWDLQESVHYKYNGSYAKWFKSCFEVAIYRSGINAMLNITKEELIALRTSQPNIGSMQYKWLASFVDVRSNMLTWDNRFKRLLGEKHTIVDAKDWMNGVTRNLKIDYNAF